MTRYRIVWSGRMVTPYASLADAEAALAAARYYRTFTPLRITPAETTPAAVRRAYLRALKRGCVRRSQ